MQQKLFSNEKTKANTQNFSDICMVSFVFREKWDMKENKEGALQQQNRELVKRLFSQWSVTPGVNGMTTEWTTPVVSSEDKFNFMNVCANILSQEYFQCDKFNCFGPLVYMRHSGKRQASCIYALRCEWLIPPQNNKWKTKAARDWKHSSWEGNMENNVLMQSIRTWIAIFCVVLPDGKAASISGDPDQLHRGLGQQLCCRWKAFAHWRTGTAEALSSLSLNAPKGIWNVLLLQTFIPRFWPVSYPFKMRFVDVLFDVSNGYSSVSVSWHFDSVIHCKSMNVLEAEVSTGSFMRCGSFHISQPFPCQSFSWRCLLFFANGNVRTIRGAFKLLLLVCNINHTSCCEQLFVLFGDQHCKNKFAAVGPGSFGVLFIQY